MEAAPLLIYGAAGYTGGLVARAMADRGLHPALGGRSEEKLRPLADSLRLPFRVASVDDPAQLDRVLEGVKVLVNAAGPFRSTAPALMDACLRQGVHYLDISGEVRSLDEATQRGNQARRRGVMVMPGGGFDVVPSDCLAAHVARRVKRPRQVSIGISGLALLSRGSAKTMIEQIAAPVWVRRGGALTQIPGSLERSFDYGVGPRASIATSWGDVVSVHFTTGAPDVTVYFEATPPVRAHTAMVSWFGWAVPFTPWQAWLKANAELLPEGPSEAERISREVTIVAEAEDDEGVVARARLRTPEAYTLTTLTMTEIAARVLGGDVEPGFQTPARLYGADFILSFSRVVREDL